MAAIAVSVWNQRVYFRLILVCVDNQLCLGEQFQLGEEQETRHYLCHYGPGYLCIWSH
jgi:hypothetical protein